MRARSRRLFSFLGAALLAAACAPRNYIKGVGDPDVGVQVTWHGHACFTIEDSVGRRLFLDPFDETVGYRVVWTDPDAVLISDDHFDHNHLMKTGPYDLVDSTGVHTVAGIEVTGIAADHDDEGGRKLGATRLYLWEMGGLRMAHLGGIGQTALTPDQLSALKGVDLLFIPVGGKVTVNGPQAAALVREIHPRIVVPMQYGNHLVRVYEFDPVEPFVNQFQNVLELPDNKFQIRRAGLPEDTTVYLPALPE
jgi:L-ascorbate metabolism protein UlaG (beta-lactamase superfamily)